MGSLFDIRWKKKKRTNLGTSVWTRDLILLTLAHFIALAMNATLACEPCPLVKNCSGVCILKVTVSLISHFLSRECPK